MLKLLFKKLLLFLLKCAKYKHHDYLKLKIVLLLLLLLYLYDLTTYSLIIINIILFKFSLTKLYKAYTFHRLGRLLLLLAKKSVIKFSLGNVKCFERNWYMKR
jgi:hypothetical protein